MASIKEDKARVSVPKFEKRGIAQWRRKFGAFIRKDKRAHLALETVRPVGGALAARTEWDERNDIALSYLSEACSDATNDGAERIVLDGLDAASSCTEILDQLEQEYFIQDNLFVLQSQKKFNNIVFTPNETGESLITRILEAKRDLVNLGKVINDDTDCFGVLLNALEHDARYTVLAAAIKTTQGMTWHNATRIIITSEASQDAPIIEKAKMAQSNNYSNLKSSVKIKCQICHKENHSADKCHFRYKGQETNKSTAASKAEPGRKKDISKVKCFNCNKMGHYSSDCKKPKSSKTQADISKKSSSNNSKNAWDQDEESANMLREQKH
jgi:hypothetical protein